MASTDPILILQMQRMGDLVLSYPLCGWLNGQNPEAPLYLVGERIFFEGLACISPPVRYFDYTKAASLKNTKFSHIINLSHRPEAAKICGELEAEHRTGSYINKHGITCCAGKWQLYRNSIHHNNKHNLFHWADLNAMDLLTSKAMQRTSWPPVRKKNPSTGRIGLFVGASEPEKRPEPLFWSKLASALINQGLKPVLLGGQQDMPVAEKVATLLKAPALNLCGKFSIHELCIFMETLDLLVVPDTGPMHIGTWLGVPVLNLSVGPVNAWETGPFAPGHFVLRSARECVGCWSCNQPDVLCKADVTPEITLKVVNAILSDTCTALANEDFAGSELFVTARDEFGLFTMLPVMAQPENKSTQALFWKLFFLMQLKFVADTAELRQRLQLHLAEIIPTDDSQELLHEKTKEITSQLLLAIRQPEKTKISMDSFWFSFPAFMRPLSSYIHLNCSNQFFAREAIMESLNMVEFFYSLLKAS